MDNNNNKDYVAIANPMKNNLIEAEYVVMENTEPVTEEYCGPKSCLVAGIIALIFGQHHYVFYYVHVIAELRKKLLKIKSIF